MSAPNNQALSTYEPQTALPSSAIDAEFRDAIQQAANTLGQPMTLYDGSVITPEAVPAVTVFPETAVATPIKRIGAVGVAGVASASSEVLPQPTLPSQIAG